MTDPGSTPTAAEAAPRGREPVFNALPRGVAVLAGLIAAAHLARMAAGADGEAIALGLLAVVPERMTAPGVEPGSGWAGLSLIGHQFVHGGLVHLLMNLAMLLQVGPMAERGLGPRPAWRFAGFFLACGVAGGLAYVAFNPGSQVGTIGASGAISGVFAGFLWGALRAAGPDRRVLRPLLVSAGVFLAINVGLAALARISGFLPIAWESHLGGFAAGLVLYPLFARR